MNKPYVIAEAGVNFYDTAKLPRSYAAGRSNALCR